MKIAAIHMATVLAFTCWSEMMSLVDIADVSKRTRMVNVKNIYNATEEQSKGLHIGHIAQR
jgi:hypothetical protein